MKTEIFGILGIAVASAILILSVKKTEPEVAMALRIAVGIAVALAVISQIEPIFTAVRTFFEQTGQDSEIIKVLLKSVGICIIVEFAADLCRDAGESALAGRVEFAGRITVTLLLIPMLTQLLEIAVTLIGV